MSPTTVTSTDRAPTRTRRPRSPLTMLTLVEAKLMLREPAALFFPLVLPVALLLILGGSIPAFREPVAELGGQRVIDAHFPALMTMLAVTIIALTILPAALAGYRDSGVLRRMSTTPVGPSRLLAAQLIVSLATTIAAVVIMIVLGRIVLGIAPPRQFAAFTVIALLGTAMFLAIGLLIAVLAPTAKSAPGLGSIVMFPLLFLGGMWLPRQNMPELLGRISDLSPTGAFATALRLTWGGTAPSLLSVAVLAGWLIIAGLLTVRLFRWE